MIKNEISSIENLLKEDQNFCKADSKNTKPEISSWETENLNAVSLRSSNIVPMKMPKNIAQARFSPDNVSGKKGLNSNKKYKTPEIMGANQTSYNSKSPDGGNSKKDYKLLRKMFILNKINRRL